MCHLDNQAVSRLTDPVPNQAVYQVDSLRVNHLITHPDSPHRSHLVSQVGNHPGCHLDNQPVSPLHYPVDNLLVIQAAIPLSNHQYSLRNSPHRSHLVSQVDNHLIDRLSSPPVSLSSNQVPNQHKDLARNPLVNPRHIPRSNPRRNHLAIRVNNRHQLHLDSRLYSRRCIQAFNQLPILLETLLSSPLRGHHYSRQRNRRVSRQNSPHPLRRCNQVSNQLASRLRSRPLNQAYSQRISPCTRLPVSLPVNPLQYLLSSRPAIQQPNLTSRRRAYQQTSPPGSRLLNPVHSHPFARLLFPPDNRSLHRLINQLGSHLVGLPGNRPASRRRCQLNSPADNPVPSQSMYLPHSPHCSPYLSRLVDHRNSQQGALHSSRPVSRLHLQVLNPPCSLAVNRPVNQRNQRVNRPTVRLSCRLVSQLYLPAASLPLSPSQCPVRNQLFCQVYSPVLSPLMNRLVNRACSRVNNQALHRHFSRRCNRIPVHLHSQARDQVLIHPANL